MIRMPKAIVMDTSTLIRSLSTLLSDKTIIPDNGESIHLFTTESVINEVKNRSSKVALQAMLSKISIISPSKPALRIVEKEAEKLGVLGKLSKTDLDVIALAVDISNKYASVYIASEDFALQNVSASLGFKIIAIGRKIRYLISYNKKCKNCGLEYSNDLEQCPACSSKEFSLVVRRRKI